MGSGFKREWRESCLSNHSDWKHMFWDKAAALAFLGTHYPWFTSTFLAYPKVVLQGARPHAHARVMCCHSQRLRVCTWTCVQHRVSLDQLTFLQFHIMALPCRAQSCAFQVCLLLHVHCACL